MTFSAVVVGQLDRLSVCAEALNLPPNCVHVIANGTAQGWPVEISLPAGTHFAVWGNVKSQATAELFNNGFVGKSSVATYVGAGAKVTFAVVPK